MIVLLKFIAVGLGGSMALILLAKVAMAQLLQRDNDYYIDEYDEVIDECASADDQGGEEHV